IVGKGENQRVVAAANVEITAGQVVGEEGIVHGEFCRVEIREAATGSRDGPIEVGVVIEIRGRVIALQLDDEWISGGGLDVDGARRFEKIPARDWPGSGVVNGSNQSPARAESGRAVVGHGASADGARGNGSIHGESRRGDKCVTGQGSVGGDN